MKSFNVHEAKTKFSSLLALVEVGEEVVILKAGVPVALLSPYKKGDNKEPRTPGLFAGKISVADDFCAPLGDEFMKHFG